MIILKKKIKVKSRTIKLDIPEKFKGKEVELIVDIEENKTTDLLKFDDIQVDTKKWKFNREDVYSK